MGCLGHFRRIADDGRQTDGSWDAPWQSAARRTDFGWTAEFAIPLTSIKYAAGENRRWGINLGRRIRDLRLSRNFSLKQLAAGAGSTTRRCAVRTSHLLLIVWKNACSD